MPTIMHMFEQWAEGINLAEADRQAFRDQVEISSKAMANDLGIRAIADVTLERLRQVDIGYDAAHDDQHAGGELARAAACYAAHPGQRLFGINSLQVPTQVWPYRWEFVPEDTVRANCVKAAALLLAEVDRIDRAAARHDT